MIPNPTNSDFAKYQFKVIQELKQNVETLTQRLEESERLRMEDQAEFLQNTIQRPLESIVETKTHTDFFNLPYVFEIGSENDDEVESDTPIFLYVKDDKNKGLRVPGRAGYIKNDGPGNLSYRLNSGEQNKWSHPATIKNGEIDTFNIDDYIEIVIVEITTDTDKTRFRTRFTPGPVE